MGPVEKNVFLTYRPVATAVMDGLDWGRLATGTASGQTQALQSFRKSQALTSSKAHAELFPRIYVYTEGDARQTAAPPTQL
jgi:hypothetical protein